MPCLLAPARTSTVRTLCPPLISTLSTAQSIVLQDLPWVQYKPPEVDWFQWCFHFQILQFILSFCFWVCPNWIWIHLKCHKSRRIWSFIWFYCWKVLKNWKDSSLCVFICAGGRSAICWPTFESTHNAGPQMAFPGTTSYNAIAGLMIVKGEFRLSGLLFCYDAWKIKNSHVISHFFQTWHSPASETSAPARRTSCSWQTRRTRTCSTLCTFQGWQWWTAQRGPKSSSTGLMWGKQTPGEPVMLFICTLTVRKERVRDVMM